MFVGMKNGSPGFIVYYWELSAIREQNSYLYLDWRYEWAPPSRANFLSFKR